MSFSNDDYTILIERLKSLADENFRNFHSALVPGKEVTYGIKIPTLRKVAKEIALIDSTGFLEIFTPNSYEETMLAAIVTAQLKMPIDEKLNYVRKFIPLIDDWATCDTFCSSFKLKKDEIPVVWNFISEYFFSDEEYLVRFSVVMMLDHFVTEDYIDSVLKILPQIKHEGYYVKMAVAWAVSICFIRFRDKTLALISQKTLDDFTQNKSIQKIRESLRVSPEDKKLLLDFKL